MSSFYEYINVEESRNAFPKKSVDINPHAPQMDHEDLLMVDQNRCKSSSLLH